MVYLSTYFPKLRLTLFALVSLYSFYCTGQNTFILKGDAIKLSSNCYRITPDAHEKSGAIWSPVKLDLTQDFELNYEIFLGSNDGMGGDGMAFVMHNDPLGFDAKGESGGGISFGDHSSRPPVNTGYGRPGIDLKIVNSVAIEFDTWSNTNTNCSPDPPFDHTTLVYNGEMCSPKIAPVQLSATLINVENNLTYPITIRWSASSSTLQFFFDRVLRISWTDDLVNNVFNGSTEVIFGFTGCTGGARNEVTVCNFEGNTTPTAADDFLSVKYQSSDSLEVTYNDVEPDGDQIYLTRISQQPQNGTASISKNKIKYVPNEGFAGRDSLRYRICDIEGTSAGFDKSYAKCASAWVYVDVECPPYSLQVTKIKDNEKCDAAIADNGSAKASILNNLTEITSGFEIRWYKGSLSPSEIESAIPFFEGSNVENLAEGIYTVVAKLINSSCAPYIQKITILRSEIMPVFDIEVVNPVTLCSSPNGKLKVTMADPLAQENFTYTWYESYPVQLATGMEISGLKAGIYQVEVRNKKTGCLATLSKEVPSAILRPTPTVTAYPNLNCVNYNGRIRAHVNGDTTSFKFYWAKQSGDSFEESGEGRTYSNLSPGKYRLASLDLTTGCMLDTLVVDVEDHAVSPAISASPIPQTSCDPQKPNGRIQVFEPLEKENYQVKFYRGTTLDNPLPDSLVSKDFVISGLSSGDYFVSITNKFSGCSSTLALLVLDHQNPEPVLQLDTLINLTDCYEKGKIKLKLDQDDSDYRVEWLYKNKILASDGFELIDLDSGNYSARAVHKITNCVSNTLSIKLLDLRIYPAITANIQRPSGCTSSSEDGKIEISSLGNSLSYKWFKVDAQKETALTGSNIQKNAAANLSSGEYKIIVLDTVSKCEASLSVLLKDASAPVAAPTIQPLFRCEPGVVNITPVDKTFRYRWYSSFSEDKFTLEGESYSAFFSKDTVVYVSALSAECESPKSKVEIFIETPLTIAINQQDGKLAGPEGNYSYKWFYQGEELGESGKQITPQKSGYYYLEVEKSSLCRYVSDSVLVEITETAEDLKNKNVVLYPNPANSRIFIELPQSWNKGRLILRDLSGRVLEQSTLELVNGTFELNVSQLKNGLYQIEFSKDDSRQYKLLIKK